MTHLDLARQFIAGDTLRGSCGPFTFVGNAALSYQTTIARKVAGVVLINSMGFSTSTSAHRGKIRIAAKEAGLRIFEVPDLHSGHGNNLRHYRALKRFLEHRLDKAVKRKPIEDLITHVEAEESAYRAVFLADDHQEAA